MTVIGLAIWKKDIVLRPALDRLTGLLGLWKPNIEIIFALFLPSHLHKSGNFYVSTEQLSWFIKGAYMRGT